MTVRPIWRTGPVLIAEWSTALPLTARCFSPLTGFELCVVFTEYVGSAPSQLVRHDFAGTSQ